METGHLALRRDDDPLDDDLQAGGERRVTDTPTGVDDILVNGVRIRRHGAQSIGEIDGLPGTILRSRQSVSRA